MKIHEILAESSGEDYRGDHTAPDSSSAPLHDLCGNGVYPADIYSSNGLRYYCQPDFKPDVDSYYLAMRLKGKPNAPVRMFRAVPKDSTIRTINPGDWVGISRAYTVDHGRGALNNNYKIISKQVFARDLFTNGDSISEWGYDPQQRDKAADSERVRSRLSKMPPDVLAAHVAETWPDNVDAVLAWVAGGPYPWS